MGVTALPVSCAYGTCEPLGRTGVKMPALRRGPEAYDAQHTAIHIGWLRLREIASGSMDSTHDTGPDGTTTPTSAEQLPAVEALIAHYERLLTEAREASRDWEHIFDAIADPICVVAADFRLIHANAAYRQLFGPTSVRGSRHSCFSPNGDDASEDGPCMECPLPATVRTRQAGSTQQVWETPGEPGGGVDSRIYQRWTYPIVNVDGTVDRVVEVIKDVTEQERMRHAITKTEALREADRLKAELLSTVSHELRSPLTVIKGYAATLLRHERRLPREERREFLEAIGKASDRLEVIINRLLEMSQLETGSIVPHLAPVDVAQLAHEAIALAEQQAQASEPGKYVFDLHLLSGYGAAARSSPTAQQVIDGDARLLRVALDNFLENAVKYSPDGGRIEVILGARSAAGAPAVTSESERAGHTGRELLPEMLEIIVRDTGMGIPAEHLGRVFEHFHRVDTRLTREVDGLGLGLALCKRIAELHSGTIWVESAPGEGSAFHLVLPMVAPNARDQAQVLAG
jgi:signal transduction histidine kinase